MRQAVSPLLFLIAGILVSFEVFTASAFMQTGRSFAEQAWSIHRFVALAAAGVAAAVAVCPDHRSLRLGRTLILGSLFGIFVSASPYSLVPERAQMTWQLGLINLVLLLGAGLFLFRRGGGTMPPGLQRRWDALTLFVRASTGGGSGR